MRFGRLFRGPSLGNYEMSVQTDRSLAQYEKELGFKIEDLKGKIVLDIGSGYHERFSKEAAKHGAVVVSINPNLKKLEFREAAKKGVELTDPILKRIVDKLRLWKWQEKSVAAKADELPFRNESFDKVLALFSVPYYSPKTKEEFRKVFDEALRVLKPGGEATFNPLTERDFKNKKHDVSAVLDEIRGKADLLFEVDKADNGSKVERMKLVKRASEGDGAQEMSEVRRGETAKEHGEENREEKLE